MTSSDSSSHFTKPTTSFWQETIPSSTTSSQPPYQYSYPAILPSSRILYLPIRQLPNNPTEAVASLIINQASLSVVEELSVALAEKVREFQPEIVIGLPTLGLSVAPIVARELGHNRYIPLGYSQKFWYTSSLSTATSSITSPLGLKNLYLDPNLLPLVEGKKALIIDDAVSSGKTLKAAWDFLESKNIGCEILGAGVCMKQGARWKAVMGEEKSENVRWVFESPLLKAVDEGWVVRE